MRELKNNKGITIIALVVTIVVILILSGITVATLSGSNGILSQAQKEKEEIAKKSNYIENKITTYEEELAKIGPDLNFSIECGTYYIKLKDISILNYKGSIDNYEYYIKKHEEGTDQYKKVTTDELGQGMLQDGLIHNTLYDVKVIAKNGEEQVLSRYKTIKTDELLCTNLILKTEDNQNYTQNMWTNKNIITSLEERNDGTTSTYASIQDSAQTINSTSADSLVSVSGLTQLKVQTTDGTNTVSKVYKLRIDRIAPTLTITSKGIADQYPETLTLSAKENEVQIDYIELPNGTRIQGQGKSTFTTTYNVTKNGPITCKVADTLGNTREQTFQVENVINFETEWTVASNTQITVPVMGSVDVYIDYGDGTKESITSENPTHTYSNAGTYTIKISGTCTSFTANTDAQSYITKLKKWGCLEATSYQFNNCTKLAGTIPLPHTQSFKNVTSVYQLFRGCTNLTGEIPTDLFKNGTNIVNFREVFMGCSNLTGTIPASLFANSLKATSFAHVFDGCKKITGQIPSELFKNNLQADYLSCTFKDCSGLTGTIPEDLFKNNTKIYSFNETFENCSGITGKIPESLFNTNNKAKLMTKTFMGCTQLSGNIPEKLFYNNPLIETFYCTFSDCSGLTGTIPENLFSQNPVVTNFYGLFMRCQNLTGAIPENLFSKNKKANNFRHVFDECCKLTEIPEKLFYNNPEATDFGCAFYTCSSITSIPKGLFEKNTKVKSFGLTFGYMANLEQIPSGIFDTTTQVTDFSNVFSNNPKITTVPEGLFDKCTEVTNFGGAFRYCVNLKTVPENLFDNCQKVTNFGYKDSFDHELGVFTDCANLTGKAPELWKRTNVTSNLYAFKGCTKLSNYADIPDDWK